MRVRGWAGLLLVGLGLVPSSAQASGAVLLLPLDHPQLDHDLVRVLEQALRRETEAALDEGQLLPSPTLGLDSLTTASGCPVLDTRCLKAIASSVQARVILARVERARPKDLFAVNVVSPRGDVKRHRALVEPVDKYSGPELRWHLSRALGVARKPPPARLVLIPEPPEDIEVWLDRRRVPRRKLAEVPHGVRQLELRGAAYEPFRWKGRVGPGRTVEISTAVVRRESSEPVLPVEAAAPPPAPQVETGPRLFHTWWLAGATVATFAVAVPILGHAVQEQEETVRAEGIDCDSPEGRVTSACQEGFDRATRTNVALAVGAGLAVGTVLAFILEDGFALFRGVSAAPAVSPEGGGVTVVGRF